MKSVIKVFSMLIMGMVFFLSVLGSGAIAAENQQRIYSDIPLLYGAGFNSDNLVDAKNMNSSKTLGKRASLDISRVKSISESVYFIKDENLFTSQASAPQNLTAVGISTSVIYLSWNEVPNTSYYNVYCYWDGAYQYYDSTIDPWYWDGGNEPNTSWWYKVTAVVNGVESIFSNYVLGTALKDGSSYLCSPPGFNAVGITSKEIFLSWEAVPNADYYNIYWYYNGNYYFFAYTHDTSYFDFVNNPGSYCSYKITCVISGIESRLSDSFGARTLYDGSSYIKAPENFKADGLSTQDIYLNWDEVTGADYYNIFYFYDGEYHWYDSTTNSAYLDKENEPNTTWKYRVTAVIDEAESGFSTEATATTLSDGSSIIQAPISSTAAGVSAQTIILNWNEVPGAECYNIYRFDNYDGKYKLYAITDELSYVDDDNISGKIFKYKVTAVKGNAESGYSNEAAGTTLKEGLVGVPSGFDVHGAGDSVYLGWNEVNGAEYYNLYGYSEGNYHWFDSTTSNYYWDDNVDLGITYQYAVSTVKAGYESGFSRIESGSACGKYTLLDLSRLARLYGAVLSDRNDLNGDNIIDIYDLVILSKQI